MKKRRPASVSVEDWKAVNSPPISSELIARMRPARRGRPPAGEIAKTQVTLRIDADILARFRSGGAGWQTRMNEALRQSAKRGGAKSSSKRAKRG